MGGDHGALGRPHCIRTKLKQYLDGLTEERQVKIDIIFDLAYDLGSYGVPPEDIAAEILQGGESEED